jgi:hypothetical protein
MVCNCLQEFFRFVFSAGLDRQFGGVYFGGESARDLADIKLTRDDVGDDSGSVFPDQVDFALGPFRRPLKVSKMRIQ